MNKCELDELAYDLFWFYRKKIQHLTFEQSREEARIRKILVREKGNWFVTGIYRATEKYRRGDEQM